MRAMSKYEISRRSYRNTPQEVPQIKPHVVAAIETETAYAKRQSLSAP